MKIVFITSTLGSGGAERVLTGYANRLSAKHDVFILKFDSKSSFYRIEKKVRVIELGLFSYSSGFVSGLLSNLRRIAVLRKTLKDISPDVSLSFQTQTNIVSLLAAKLSGFRIYIFERTNNLYEKSILWTVLRRIFYPISDKLFVLSDFDKNYYSKFVREVVKLHNPVLINVPDKNPFNEKENIILAAGRFDENKQFGLLIKIFAGLGENDYKLVIAGEGPLKDEYEQIAKQCRISDRVEIIPLNPEIERLYARAKIFCLTSLMEGFPNVLIEAMSWGCVPAAFDCITGPGEIIKDGEDGFLIAPYDASLFSGRLKKLVSDPDLLRKMSERAFINSKRFAPERIMRKLEKQIS